MGVVPENVLGLFHVFSKYSKIHQIKIYSLDGSIKHSENLNGIHEYLLNISHLLSGFYILVISSSDGIITFKILHR